MSVNDRIRAGEPPTKPSQVEVELARQDRRDLICGLIAGSPFVVGALMLLASRVFGPYVEYPAAAFAAVFVVVLLAQFVSSMCLIGMRLWPFGLAGIALSIGMLIASALPLYGPAHWTPDSRTTHRHSIWIPDHVH